MRAKQTLKIGEIRVEGARIYTMEHPAGTPSEQGDTIPEVVTDERYPRISFSLKSGRQGSSLQKAAVQVGDWQVETKEQTGIRYAGPALAPFTIVPVRILAVDDAGEETEAKAFFRTGRLDLPWQAHWISDPKTPEQGETSPTPVIFRKRFVVPEGARSLTLCVSALGIYDLYLDGERLQE